jgi:hypothetical protein
MNRREVYFLGIAMLILAVGAALGAEYLSAVINPLFSPASFSSSQVRMWAVLNFVPFIVLLPVIESVGFPTEEGALKKLVGISLVIYFAGLVVTWSVYLAEFVRPVKSFAGGAAILDGIWCFTAIAVTAAVMCGAYVKGVRAHAA